MGLLSVHSILVDSSFVKGMNGAKFVIVIDTSDAL